MLKALAKTLTLSVCVMLAGCKDSGPSDTYLSIQSHARSGVWDKVYDAMSARMRTHITALLSGEIAEEELGREQFAQVMEAGPLLDGYGGQIAEQKITSPGRAEVSITLADGAVGVVFMIKENGDWKVDQDVMWVDTPDAQTMARRSQILSMLQIVRSQIELYNRQNPASPRDRDTDRETFWDALIDGGYLAVAPKNLLQSESSMVSDGPEPGIGWIWAERSPGKPETLNLYAVDENGDWFVEDSSDRSGLLPI
jgi:hypothetical protein